MIRGKDWKDNLFSGAPRIGDLVSMNSAPPSIWYLSWVRDITVSKGGFTKYLLESIEDGSLCWWENVGINYYNRERVQESVRWQWDDKQFAFADRVFRVCKKYQQMYVLPVLPVFNPDGSVVLNVRVKWRLSTYENPKTFPNWKKVTIKMILSHYEESVQGYLQCVKHVKTAELRSIKGGSYEFDIL